MSDSDTDGFSNDVFTYQNQGTRVCAKGPNVNTASFSVQNNNMFMTSAMNTHWNMERPRYAESVYDQRSMYSRRETSPMSFHSASHLRNLHHSYYPGGMSSQRSIYNGRSGSPMSVQTAVSNTSAVDIALALTTGKYNSFDIKILKEACNKFMKHRVRNRIAKRRNLRKILKGCRRVSGGESGDQASNSSISSDDHRSVKSCRTATFNDNATHSSSRISLMNLRKSMKESKMHRDCTEDLRQNWFRNMLSVPPRSMQEHLQPRLHNTSLMSKSARHGFPLPSQRFNANKFVAPLSIPEMPSLGIQVDNQLTNGIQKGNRNDFNKNHTREPSQKPISEQEEIFSEISMMQKNHVTKSQRKRIFEEDNITISNTKKSKLSTTVKNVVKHDTLKPKQTFSISNSQGNQSDFVFPKPQQPVKKPTSVKNLNVKSQQVSSGQFKSIKGCGTIPSKTQTPQIALSPKQQEIVIAKSQTPVKEIISQIQTSKKTVYQSPEKLISKWSQPLDLEQERNLPQNNYEKEHEMTHSTIDVSNRPSFIKRKLFTQKVDETENSGSSESLQTQSPQSNIYSKIQKEKNKARKFVTQSCLSRDLGDNSNWLDLIHKIVPPDLMNLTTATNKSEMQMNKSKIQMNKSKSGNSNKWDITAIVTSNKNEELSDTYTDDEIFNTEETKQDHAKNKLNDVEENYKKENVNRNQTAKNKTSSTLKTVDKQCKPNTKIVIDNNTNYNKVLLKNSEKTETCKKTETNNRTKKHPNMSNSCKVTLPKISPQIFKQIENVQNLLSHNEPTVDKEGDFNKKQSNIENFWNESDSDYVATPLKKPELKGKGLPTTIHSVSNQRNITQKEIPIKQAIVAKTTITTSTILHTAQTKTNKLLDDAPNRGKMIQNKEKNALDDAPKKGKVIQSKEKIAVDDAPNKREVIQSKNKIADKLQVNKNVKVQQNKKNTFNNGLKSKENNTETSEKTYTKPLGTTKVNTNRKEDKIQKIIIHSPVQIRAQRIPKINHCCADRTSNNTLNASNEWQLCKMLRSRVIDLSSSLDKESSPLNKKTDPKNKQKPVINKNVKKVSNKENIPKSDHSFTLASKTPLARKLAAKKKVNKVNSVKQNVNKSRQSDVSFTLRAKIQNHATANTRRSKEVEKLQLNTSMFFNSGKNLTLSKRVEPSRLNRSSARLNRNKIH